MNQPRATVVIPTRNRRALLGRALTTVLRQRDVDLEVIVVDDGSSDGTAAFVRSLADRRVTVVGHDVPKGVAAARNAGIERSRGEWVAFLDDDDFWAPDKLVSQIAAAEAVGASWVCAGAVVVDEGLRIIGGLRTPDVDSLPELLSYNLIPGGGSGTIVATDAARSVGGFDLDLNILADWDMWIRLWLQSAPAAVDRPLVAYLRHGGSMSHLNRGFTRELDLVEEKHRAAREQRDVVFSRARWLRWDAQMQLRSGDRRAATTTYLHLARTHGDKKSLLRAIVGAAAPALAVRRWQRRSYRQVALAWRQEAEAWLRDLEQLG